MDIFFSWRFSPSQLGGRILFVLVGGLFLIFAIVFLTFFMNTFWQVQRYAQGTCTITAKQLLRREDVEQQVNSSNGTTHTYTTISISYAPDFQFIVHTTDGRSYASQGYDAFQSSSSDQAGEQAIVDRYKVGEAYPCWYNPANPVQSVLTRQFDWFILILPGIFFLVGVPLVIVGLLGILGIFLQRGFVLGAAR
jgi:hypothetical protein